MTFSIPKNQPKLSLPLTYLWVLFFFFLTFPDFNIFGISLTFYLFILIVVFSYLEKIPLLEIKRTPIDFALIGLACAALFSIWDPAETWIQRSRFEDFKILLQYLYWISLPFAISSSFRFLPVHKILCSLTVGSVCACIYYFVPFEFSLITKPSQNGLAFLLVATGPLIVYYVYCLREKTWAIVSSVFLLIIVNYTRSRAGFVVFSLELLLISGYLISKFKYLGPSFLLVIIPVCFMTGILSLKGSPLQKSVAKIIKPMNNDMARFVGNPSIVFNYDGSWGVRKNLVKKGKELVRKNPMFGVGVGRFRYVWADITLDENSRKSIQYYNKRSSHNSYIQWLAETGIVGFIFLGVLMILTMYHFIKCYVSSIHINLKLVTGLALLGIFIHWYAISAITGALFWTILGIFLGIKCKIY